VRLARAAFKHLLDEERGRESRSGQILASTLEGGHPRPAGEPLLDFIRNVMGSEENEGLRAVIAQVFNLTRMLRERLTLDAWRIVQQLDEKVSHFRVNLDDPLAGWPELLDEMVSLIAAFLGLADDVMIGSRSWRFLDIGRRLERCIFISGLLANSFAHSNVEPALLESVVEINESSFPYRRRYRMQLEVPAVVDLLMADATNPRAVVFQLDRADEHLAELPRDSSRADGDRDRKLLQSLVAIIHGTNILKLCQTFADGNSQPLLSFLSDVGLRTGEIAEAVAGVYFSHTAVHRALGVVDRDPST
jgi:uncharacterized alpha-E superfamily protein